MRHYPGEDYEIQELEELNVEPWMVELLKVNPSYVSWGPHEDYMWKEKDGWDSRIMNNSWEEFGPWNLDEYNEVVNFYFHLSRESETCETCNGHFYHPDALWVSESFYRHSSPFTAATPKEREIVNTLNDNFGFNITDSPLGRDNFPSNQILAKYGKEFKQFCIDMMNGDGYWCDKIAPDEAEELRKEHRCHIIYGNEEMTSEELAASFNNDESHKRSIGHDAINRSILIRKRLERFGIPVNCPTCEGRGYVYTEEKGHLCLTLWVLHPRKGCSRGVEIKNIQKKDLKSIREFLELAARRNAERFSKIGEIK